MQIDKNTSIVYPNIFFIDVLTAISYRIDINYYAVVLHTDNIKITIQELTKQLPKASKEIIDYKYLNKMTCKDISILLDKPYDSILSDLHKSLEFLCNSYYSIASKSDFLITTGETISNRIISSDETFL